MFNDYLQIIYIYIKLKFTDLVSYLYTLTV